MLAKYLELEAGAGASRAVRDCFRPDCNRLVRSPFAGHLDLHAAFRSNAAREQPCRHRATPCPSIHTLPPLPRTSHAQTRRGSSSTRAAASCALLVSSCSPCRSSSATRVAGSVAALRPSAAAVTCPPDHGVRGRVGGCGIRPDVRGPCPSADDVSRYHPGPAKFRAPFCMPGHVD